MIGTKEEIEAIAGKHTKRDIVEFLATNKCTITGITHDKVYSYNNCTLNENLLSDKRLFDEYVKTRFDHRDDIVYCFDITDEKSPCIRIIRVETIAIVMANLSTEEYLKNVPTEHTFTSNVSEEDLLEIWDFDEFRY